MPRFSDQFLVLMMQKAVRCVNLDLCITGTTEEITIDASGCITPLNGDLEALVLMKTECLISQRDYNSDLNTGAIGVRVDDGEQSIDTRSKTAARASFFDSKYGPCGSYIESLKLAKICRLGDSSGSGGGELIW
jgi:hypothetical protein